MRPCPGCGSSAPPPFFCKNGFALVRCASCSLVYVGDPPTADELRRYYSFESGYGLESRDDGAEMTRLSRLAERHLGCLERHSARGRVLDVGCGAGFFLQVAHDAGWRTKGLELNEGTASLARERGLDVVVGTLVEGAVPPASFDAVTLWDVLEHVREPVAMLAAAHDALREGGVLALSTPNLDGLGPRLSYPTARLTGYWTYPEPPAHLVQFSLQTLRRLLANAGFETVDVAHERTPVKYTLAPGGLRRLVRSPARALYAAAFLLPHLLGPRFRMGDEIVVVARRSRRPPVLPLSSSS